MSIDDFQRHLAAFSMGFKDEPSRIVGNAATICSVIVYLAPVNQMFSIAQNADAEETPTGPYILLMAQAVLWCVYGIVRQDVGILRISGIGSLMAFVFCVVLNYYARHRTRWLTRLGFILSVSCLVGFIWAVGMYVEDMETQATLFGYTATGVTLCMYGAPLSQAMRIVKTKDTSGVPIWMNVCTFLSAALWGQYALMTGSIPYFLPNAAGVVLTGLLLGAICYSKAPAGLFRRRYSNTRYRALSTEQELRTGSTTREFLLDNSVPSASR